MTTHNFDALATYFDGTPIKANRDRNNPMSETFQPTYSYIVCEALSHLLNEQKDATVETRQKRSKLLKRVFAGGDIELDNTEKTWILDAVGKLWVHQQIFGQVEEIVEGRRPIGPPSVSETADRLIESVTT